MSRRLARPRDALPSRGKSRKPATGPSVVATTTSDRGVFMKPNRPSATSCRRRACAQPLRRPIIVERGGIDRPLRGTCGRGAGSLRVDFDGGLHIGRRERGFGTAGSRRDGSRRAVSAQDLPISITAVSGDSLDQAGIQDMAGLAHSMAGVNYTDRGPFGGVNGSTLIIRGLNSESLAFQEGLATSVVPPVATVCRRYAAVLQYSPAGPRPRGGAARTARHSLWLGLARRHDSFRDECARPERL